MQKIILHLIILIWFFSRYKVCWDNRNLSHSTVSNRSHKLSDFDESYINPGMLAKIWAFGSYQIIKMKSFR